jgi:small subunit ribosomal protein S6
LKKYQGVFILFPPADEAALEAKLETIRGEITKQGGTVSASTRMGRNAFARPLRKKDSGFYVLISFTIEPSRVATLRNRLKLNEDVLRVEIVLAHTWTQETPKPAADKPAATA